MEKDRRTISREIRLKEEKKKKKPVKVKRADQKELLREVTVKIGLERMDIYKGITVKTLLDNSVTDIVMSLEFVRKQRFRLKKVKKLIYRRNMNGIFNKKEPIDHIVE